MSLDCDEKNSAKLEVVMVLKNGNSEVGLLPLTLIDHGCPSTEPHKVISLGSDPLSTLVPLPQLKILWK
jgi:hypothetical protein